MSGTCLRPQVTSAHLITRPHPVPGQMTPGTRRPPPPPLHVWPQPLLVNCGCRGAVLGPTVTGSRGTPGPAPGRTSKVTTYALGRGDHCTLLGSSMCHKAQEVGHRTSGPGPRQGHRGREPQPRPHGRPFTGRGWGGGGTPSTRFVTRRHSGRERSPRASLSRVDREAHGDTWAVFPPPASACTWRGRASGTHTYAHSDYVLNTQVCKSISS